MRLRRARQGEHAADDWAEGAALVEGEEMVHPIGEHRDVVPQEEHLDARDRAVVFDELEWMEEAAARELDAGAEIAADAAFRRGDLGCADRDEAAAACEAAIAFA